MTITDHLRPDNGTGWDAKYLCGTSWSHNEDARASTLCKYVYHGSVLTVLFDEENKDPQYHLSGVLYIDTKSYYCEYYRRYVYERVPTENHYNVACARAMPVTP